MDLKSYFNNSAASNQSDSSTFFDDLATSSPTDIPTSPNPVEDASDSTVPDEIRDFWETPVVEAGKPPILTTPGIMSPDDLSDNIKSVVSTHLGENELALRRILGPDDVTQDERGLRNLISSGCFHSAVNLTKRLLTKYGQGYGRAGQPAKHSPHSLQLWFTRLTLLAKLGLYDDLMSEVEAFGSLNRADIFYEFYPENGERKGSMACFMFRLFLCEIPIYSGNKLKALNRLTDLKTQCDEIIKYFTSQKNLSGVEFWNKRRNRVLYSIINCGILMKDYTLINDIIQNLVSMPDLAKEEKRALFSAWGRIYLQVGDIFGAEQHFAEARRLRNVNSTPDLRDLVDKGLISVAKNDFQEAYSLFQKALHFDNGNTMILNNMGVCLLYGGKLKDAINLYERAIEIHPQKALNESLLINLSTLYELESSKAKSKKLGLLRLVNKYKPDLHRPEFCLKLQA